MSLTVEETLLAEFLRKPVTSHLLRDAEALSALLPSLEAIAVQFAGPDDLLPVDCDRAVLHLRKLKEPTSRLQQFLKQADLLPSTVHSQRFDLLASLYFIETKSQEVAMEIARYRLMCFEWNPKALQQRATIQPCLAMLVQVADKVSNQIMFLLESFPLTTHGDILNKNSFEI